MAITNTQPPVRPAKDEWGVYDPQQAGLEALFARLDRPKPIVDDRPKAVEDQPKANETPTAPERPTLSDAK